MASTTDSYEQAEWLARMMVDIGHGMGVDTTAVLTEMDTPIGYTIGNALEVLKASSQNIVVITVTGPGIPIRSISKFNFKMRLLFFVRIK